MQNKILYTVRVIAISFEAVVLAAAYALWITSPIEVQSVASLLLVDPELTKFLMLLPSAIAAWVFNECRALLQEDKETIRVLVQWEDYWRLKIHVWAALLYTSTFTLISLAPWLAKSAITSGGGLILFAASLVGQFVVAIGVYTARIRVKELLVHLKAP